APSRPTTLFGAITGRHTNHRPYDPRPAPSDVTAALEALAAEPGIEIHLTDDARGRERVDELTLEADAVQFADPAWRKELGYWLGQGVFGTHWLLSKAAKLAVSHLNLVRRVAKKDHE